VYWHQCVGRSDGGGCKCRRAADAGCVRASVCPIPSVCIRPLPPSFAADRRHARDFSRASRARADFTNGQDARAPAAGKRPIRCVQNAAAARVVAWSNFTSPPVCGPCLNRRVGIRCVAGRPVIGWRLPHSNSAPITDGCGVGIYRVGQKTGPLCAPGQHTAKRRRVCTRQSRSCL